MSQPLIDLQHISKSFDGEMVLDDLSLSIKENSFVTLLGPSGCGKSTTLRIIGGFTPPDKGNVIFDGQDITKLPPNKRQLNTVFQKYALFPHMTIAENIAFGLKIKNKPKSYIDDKIKYALKLVNLSGFEKRDVTSLSGGQQQRIAIARAIVNEPRVLLLDEPFSAMDTYLREGLRLELSKVLADYDGVSVMVTHDRDEAFQLCKNIMLLDKGHVLIAGNSRKIFQDPVTCKAARLTGCKNISKIERIGEYRVRALDWDNLEFVTDRTVGDDITAIGIRAHDFEPLAGEEAKARKAAGEENLIPSGSTKIHEGDIVVLYR